MSDARSRSFVAVGWLVVLAVVAVMVFLSGWQFQRSRPHTDAALLAESRATPAVPATDLLGGVTRVLAPMVGRRIDFEGRYREQQWLVPRQEGIDAGGRAQGPEGYLVVAAFAPESGAGLPATVLVVRGWVAAPGDAPSPPAGDRTLRGWIAAPEALSATLTGSLPAGQLPDLAAARVADQVPGPLLDGTVGLVRPDGPGLAPAPEPVPAPAGGWSIVNLGYSLQWLVFALAAVWMWVEHLRSAARLQTPLEREQDAAPETDATASPAEASPSR